MPGQHSEATEFVSTATVVSYRNGFGPPAPESAKSKHHQMPMAKYRVQQLGSAPAGIRSNAVAARPAINIVTNTGNHYVTAFGKTSQPLQHSQ